MASIPMEIRIIIIIFYHQVKIPIDFGVGKVSKFEI